MARTQRSTLLLLERALRLVRLGLFRVRLETAGLHVAQVQLYVDRRRWSLEAAS